MFSNMVAYLKRDFNIYHKKCKILFLIEGTDQGPGLLKAALSAVRITLCHTQVQQVQQQQSGGPGGHGPHPQLPLLAGNI